MGYTFRISIYVSLLIVGTICELYNSFKEHGTIIWTPKDLCNRTEYSLAGAWIAFIAMCIISPMMAIVKLVRWLCKRKGEGE